MKDSLKKFYDYLDSDNELTTYVRLNAEWNEKSFCEMRKLVKEVMEDYTRRIIILKGLYIILCQQFHLQ